MNGKELSEDGRGQKSAGDSGRSGAGKSPPRKPLPPLGPPLEGYQRKYLRGLAHPLKAVVQVGQHGITDAVIAAIDDALYSHELIKVRLYEPKDKKAMSEELAKRSAAHLCGLIGHNVMLYRPHPDEPEIRFPRRKAARRS